MINIVSGCHGKLFPNMWVSRVEESPHGHDKKISRPKLWLLGHD